MDGLGGPGLGCLWGEGPFEIMRSSVLSHFGSSMLKPLPFSTMAGKTGKAGGKAGAVVKKNTSTAADQAPNGVGDFKKLYSQCVGPTSS